MKIQNKIIIWFLIPSILIATIAAAFCYFYIRNTVKQNIFDQLKITANWLQEDVHTFLRAKRERIIDFSSDGFIRNYTEKITMKETSRKYYTSALNDHLVTNKKSLDPSILEVFVVDFRGRVIASADEGRIGENVLGEEYFEKVELLSVFASDPHYDTRLKTIVIDFSTVLSSRIGQESIGIIVNRIRFEQHDDGSQDKESVAQIDEWDYSKLIAVNKARIMAFSTDGFIMDYTEEIVRGDEGVFYNVDLLNKHLLLEKQPIDPNILAIFIVDLNGKVISSTELGQIGRNFSDETFFTETMEKDSYISDLRYPPGLRQNAFFDAARLLLNKSEQKPTGIIVNRYNGDSLIEITHSGIAGKFDEERQLEGMGETGEMYVVDSNKLMITESRFIEDTILKQVVDTEGVRVAFENGKGMTGIYPNYRGIKILGVSRYVDEMDWVVLAEKDVFEAFAPVVRLRNFAIGIGAAGVIAVVVIAIFISKRITGSIQKLVTTANIIAEGNLTEEVKIKSKDEVGSLAKSFDTMRLKLSKLFKDIEGSKRDWESAFDSVLDIIVIYGKDLKIARCNKELLSRLNVKHQDIVGRSCYEIFHEGEDSPIICEVYDVSKTGRPVTKEKLVPRLHGIFRISCFPRFDDNGEYVGVVQIMTDITIRKQMETKLHASEERFRTIIERSADGLIIIDRTGILRLVNPAAETLFGRKAEQLIRGEFGFPVIAGKTSEINIILKDGGVAVAEMSVADMELQGENVYLASLRDITIRKKSEEQILSLSQAIKQSPSVTIITDTDGKIKYVNRKFTEITGYTFDEVVGKNPSILKSGKTPIEEYKKLWETITSGGEWRGELCNRKKNGELYWEFASISPVRDIDGNITGYLGVAEDLTERRHLLERVDYAVRHDPLTELPNRILFNDRLERTITRLGKREKNMFAVLFINIDRFKIINDSMGQAFGDQMLKAIAKRLASIIRETDTIARVGGDEFLIMLDEVADLQAVNKIADKTIKEVSNPFVLDAHEIFVTASIGISVFPQDDKGPEGLIKKAGIAMRHVKEMGKNNYQFYDTTMKISTRKALMLENDLHRALENNEFLVYYQPQVEIKTGKLIGMESLVRWHHSSHGMISPSDFIPLAEKTGLIIPIGEWVLRTACRQNKAWQEEGLPCINVAVNFSALQFHQKNIVDIITNVLQETGLKPGCFGLEITEGIIIKEPDVVIKKLQALKEAGVHISMDDFGTGYSSLSYLSRFPIDTLKIDQSFIRGARGNEDKEIVKAIIAMAHSLDIKTIAEGVETAVQLEYLRSLGCNAIQGYFYSKPLPAEEATKLLREGRHLV